MYMYAHMCTSSHIPSSRGPDTHIHNSLKHDGKVGLDPGGFSLTAQHIAPHPRPKTHRHTHLLIGYYLGCLSLSWFLMKGHGCHFSADGHHGYMGTEEEEKENGGLIVVVVVVVGGKFKRQEWNLMKRVGKVEVFECKADLFLFLIQGNIQQSCRC